MTEVLRFAAFTEDPSGGNPAGIVLDASGLDADQMQAIAVEVGYSETAFLVAAGDRSYDVRYFAPSAEVSFCGHATIATGVALAERHGAGRFLLHSKVGDVPLDVEVDDRGRPRAVLTSVEPALRALPDDDLAALLRALRWSPSDLDPRLPVRVAYAGAWHPVIAVMSRARLADLSYDFDALQQLMSAWGWTTIQLIWRETPTLFHARDPFAVGGVVEDPATGAAAAALGHYLRELRLVDLPARITVRQGDDMGRPSVLIVDVDGTDPRIKVSGHAVHMNAPIASPRPASGP
ncbi:MAG: PhzF family phenazine biosynthesis protein [Acidothermaceae bacterium]